MLATNSLTINDVFPEATGAVAVAPDADGGEKMHEPCKLYSSKAIGTGPGRSELSSSTSYRGIVDGVVEAQELCARNPRRHLQKKPPIVFTQALELVAQLFSCSVELLNLGK